MRYRCGRDRGEPVGVRCRSRREPLGEYPACRLGCSRNVVEVEGVQRMGEDGRQPLSTGATGQQGAHEVIECRDLAYQIANTDVEGNEVDPSEHVERSIPCSAAVTEWVRGEAEGEVGVGSRFDQKIDSPSLSGYDLDRDGPAAGV